MPTVTESKPRAHYARAAQLFIAKAVLCRELAAQSLETLSRRIPGAFITHEKRAELLADVTFSRGRMRANALQAVRCARKAYPPISTVWNRNTLKP